jgi:hypothetical protein
VVSRDDARELPARDGSFDAVMLFGPSTTSLAGQIGLRHLWTHTEFRGHNAVLLRWQFHDSHHCLIGYIQVGWKTVVIALSLTGTCWTVSIVILTLLGIRLTSRPHTFIL